MTTDREKLGDKIADIACGDSGMTITVLQTDEIINAVLDEVKRRTDDGLLAECPLCKSLDIGGAHDTVNCYGCGLKITKPRPLQNAIDAWNMRNGEPLPSPPEQLKDKD